MLEERLVTLKKELITYAGLVESMVEKSMAGLLKADREALKEVMDKDEPRANRFDLEMDEMCTSLIAQFQPRAKNLRVILMVLKMSSDLERMGDHAVNIAESGAFLIERPSVKPLVDLPEMGKLTILMLRDSINSFINEDAVLAKSVCERDNTVDALRTKIVTELSVLMGRDPSAVERSLHLLRISGNLERIADLSTNICEDVLFMVQGRVIKHHAEEMQEGR
ncbi:MAG: phosphate signaling complex protein PhoU [Endomicrobiales bacterium]